VAKVENEGRTKAELDKVIEWMPGFDEAALSSHLEAGTTLGRSPSGSGFFDWIKRASAEGWVLA